MKIEKLRNPYVRGNEGCSVSMIDLLEKINEIIDAMNGEHDPADIYSEDGRLIAKKDESEDERIRKWLIDYFSSIKKTVWIHRDITCEQILDWLEKQKPAEWGEEDERRIDAICELLENTSAIHPNYSRRKLIIWLKSLRPSWKPNEEQMKALERASTNKYLSAKQFDILVSLYEQLKKL